MHLGGARRREPFARLADRNERPNAVHDPGERLFVGFAPQAHPPRPGIAAVVVLEGAKVQDGGAGIVGQQGRGIDGPQLPAGDDHRIGQARRRHDPGEYDDHSQAWPVDSQQFLGEPVGLVERQNTQREDGIAQLGANPAEDGPEEPPAAGRRAGGKLPGQLIHCCAASLFTAAQPMSLARPLRGDFGGIAESAILGRIGE
jgi:hypothetical protein